jgi:hypothetical protein
MSNTSIQLKKSGATGNTPTGLAFGEVAINYADGKLYYKNAMGGTSYISNQFSFDTINANNSLILATGVSDTLSFVAGNNITISTNTTTKTITIDSTASGGGGSDTYARDTANAAFLQANSAYGSQNTTGSYANSAFAKANNALANTNGATFGGDLNVTGKLSIIASSGDEGGEIFLAQAQSNTTLSGGITIDSYQNKIRFFEQGGSARGAYIDLTECIGGAGTNLLNPGATPDSTARATANAAFLQANAAYESQNTTGTYANSAYTQANTATTNAATADSKAVTAGSYANSAYTQANTATNNAAGASLYANGAFIQANAAFNRANSVLGGFRANTLIVANGTGFLSNSNAEFSLSNNTLYVPNANISNEVIANSLVFYDGTRLNSATGISANTAATANVTVYARMTNVTTGTYFPIVTDTTITGSDTLHYSSNDFLMYAANNTFRATGNVWAGQFLTVGSNVPVVNSTGHWVGQTISAGSAGSANTANVAINARITNVTTGTYFPIVTDTTITGSDTLHYSSNDFLMYAANNTFRAAGNVWAGQFLTVGTNIPVVNSTGHWVGQTINAIDSFARSTGNSAGLYANSAFIAANTADSKAVTSGSYANAAFAHANAAFNAANTGGGGGSGNASFIFSGTSNVFFATANGNIVANVDGNTIATVTNTGIQIAGGNLNGANNIYANTFIANNTITISGSGGDISGANNITGNNIIAVNGVTVAGLNVVPHLQSAFLAANTPSHVANSSALYANGAFIQANAAFNRANNSVANTANTANVATVAINARITIVNTGIYYPIVTDTTVTGSDTLHYSSNDFLMYAANNTFRAAGNVWAGEFIAVGTNIPVVNSTGHWVGQTVNGVDSLARTNAASAGSYANSAFIAANTADSKAVTAGSYANSAFSVANTDVTNINITGGVYGNSSSIPVITLAANGRVIAVSNVTVSGGGGSGEDQFARNTANAAFIQANAAFNVANTGGGGGVSNNGSSLSGTITPLANTSSQFNIIGITGDITIAAPAGTPTEGQKLIIRLKDAGTGVNISWNVIYKSIGFTLPTSTVANKTAYIGFIYNTVDADWDGVAISLES